MPARNRRTYRKKPVAKRLSFQQRVRSVLNVVAEKKVAKLNPAAIPIGQDMTIPYRLMPGIRQGNSGHGERIGNEISLKKLTIKGWISIQSNASVGGDTEHLSRMFIIKQRDVNSDALIDADSTLNPLFDSNNLMEYQQPYIGSSGNWLQSVNSDAFIVRRDIRKHYSTTANYQGTDTQVPNPKSIKFFTITLTFGKGKTLNYSTDTETQSGDFPYFLLCALHQPDGTQTAGNSLLEYYTEADYTDI